MSSPDAPCSNTETTANGLPKADITEAEWYATVYQGDKVPQLTWRAVLTGGLLGMAMAASNLYTTLKIGWAFGVAITACVLSFVIWNVLQRLTGGRMKPLSILENNCMQSTASAAGVSTGATIGTAFGALLLLEGVHQPWWAVAIFTLLTGAMGVFLAVPMKRQMINQERLAFPSGTAAAVTLKSLYSKGAEAVRQAHVLVWGLVVGAGIGVLNTGTGTLRILDRLFEKLPWIMLPEQVPANGFWLVNGRPLAGFGFESSVLLIGAGMITGLRVSLSMLAGSLLLYVVVGPYLIGLDAAQAGTAGYIVSIPLGGAGYNLARWALWGGTSLMVFSSLAAFALQWRTIARSFRSFRKKAPTGDTSLDETMARIEVPMSWLVAGMVPISIGMLVLNVVAFHVNVWLGLVAIVMSFVLTLVACRATGETDTTPIGAMGKVMQLLFAVLSPPSASSMQLSLQHNLLAAGTAANSASSAADLLTDLKSGYLLGANPRRQFLAQFYGLFFGLVAIIPCWYLMVPTKEALERFNPPATNMWYAVAKLLSGGGFAQLAPSARWAILIGGLVGVALPLIDRLWPKLRPWMPSCMGLGLAWVMPFTNAQSFAIGAVLVWAWTKWNAKSAENYNVPLASGLIAGESLIKAVIAMAATALGLLGWS
jgi:putative OPT family oligopeptide transporter